MGVRAGAAVVCVRCGGAAAEELGRRSLEPSGLLREDAWQGIPQPRGRRAQSA